MRNSGRILTLDIGSSSVRARFYDRRLEAQPADLGAVRAYDWRLDDGAMETDPRLLFDHVIGVVDNALTMAEQRGFDIVAVAVTTFWHSLMGAAEAGVPLTPLFGWGDARAAVSVAYLSDRLDATEFHRRTGCFLHPTYPAVKLAWLRMRDPVGFERVARWISFGEYLEDRLFGVSRCSHSIASGTGLLNVRTLEWDGITLAALGLTPGRLGALSDLEPMAGLLPEWALRWRDLDGVPWFPAIGDGAAANVGSGAIGADRPALTVGTSAAVRILRKAKGESPHPDLWDYQLDRNYRVAGGAFSNGGNGLSFLLKTLAGLDRERVDALLRDAEPDSHDLTVIPALAPERGFGLRSGEGATLAGLRLDSSADSIAQAWLESISHRIAELLEELEHVFGPASIVWASGGALFAIPNWLRTFADSMNRPVRLAADPEATSRGAAIMVAREIGWIPSIEAAPSIDGAGFDPDLDRYRIHRSAMARELRLAEAIHAASVAPSRPVTSGGRL